VFKPALLPLLERVHDATSHRGRFPGCTPAPLVTHDILAELRRKLAAAIAAENYEEAAALRDQLKRVETAGGAADATGQVSGGAGREPQ
jgi:protein arginine kinase activator